MRLLNILLILLAIFSVHSTVESCAEEVNSASIDLSIPDNPAFKVLGVTPKKIDRPGSPREFGASLANGVDANGNFQSGIAMDVSVMRFARNTQLETYQKDYGTRFLDRTDFSFGTTKGASETDKSIKMALGVKLTPWDDSDPRLDKPLIQCLKDAVDNKTLDDDGDLILINESIIKEIQNKKGVEVGSEEYKKIEVKIKKLNAAKNKLINQLAESKIKFCRTEAKSSLWNKSGLSVAIAPTFISETGNTNNIKYSGLGAWTSVSYGIEDYAQIIGQLMYRNNEEVPVTNATNPFFKRDSINFGGQIRFGKPNINGNLEALYSINDNKGGAEDDNIFKYSAGIEFNPAKDFWISLSIGSEFGNNTGNKLYALGDMKWAFESAPTMAPK